jgi:hypothetical protein
VVWEAPYSSQTSALAIQHLLPTAGAYGQRVVCSFFDDFIVIQLLTSIHCRVFPVNQTSSEFFPLPLNFELERLAYPVTGRLAAKGLRLKAV